MIVIYVLDIIKKYHFIVSVIIFTGKTGHITPSHFLKEKKKPKENVQGKEADMPHSFCIHNSEQSEDF